MLSRKTARIFFLLLALVSLVLILAVAVVRPGLSFGGAESLFGSSPAVVPVGGEGGGGSGGRSSPSLKPISEERRVTGQGFVTIHESNESGRPANGSQRAVQATEKPPHDANSPSQQQSHAEDGIPENATSSKENLLPRPDSYTCDLSNCIEVLTIQEQNRIKSCEKQTVQHVGHTLDKPTCKFIKGRDSRAPVALNSQEGSGNTWLRGLLEKATGICTGFYLCDTEMRPRGFLGEHVQSGRVLVVKTHVHIPQWTGEKKIAFIAYDSSYSSAVYLIRNPAHGVITEWNRVVTLKKMPSLRKSHTNVISKEEFGTPEWTRFFDEYIYKWRVRTVNWVLNNHNHPVHVVSYEDLKRDRVREVEKILDFLKFPYYHEELVERLSEDYTVFRRPHAQEDFQHFSEGEKEKLKSAIESLQTSARKARKEHLFLFDEYLQSLSHIT